MTYQQIVDELPIGRLTNTPDNTFWYTSSRFGARYEHENGKAGDTFYDGNNGDKWIVTAINTEYRRAIVTNKTQGGVRLVYWERF